MAICHTGITCQRKRLLPVTRVLLGAGADPNIRPREYDLLLARKSRLRYSLDPTVRKYETTLTSQMKWQYEYDVDLDGCLSLLHHCTRYEVVAWVRLLLEFDTDPWATDFVGLLPWHYAILRQSLGLTKAFLDSGFEPPKLVPARSDDSPPMRTDLTSALHICTFANVLGARAWLGANPGDAEAASLASSGYIRALNIIQIANISGVTNRDFSLPDIHATQPSQSVRKERANTVELRPDKNIL